MNQFYKKYNILSDMGLSFNCLENQPSRETVTKCHKYGSTLIKI